VDTTYKKAPYVATAQVFKGETGNIDNDGWEITVGLEPTKQNPGVLDGMSKYCKGLYLRYGEMNIDVPKTTSTITWDTKQFAASYVLPLKSPNFKAAKWLQFEYEHNTEKTVSGADQIPNDLFFVELFTAF